MAMDMRQLIENEIATKMQLYKLTRQEIIEDLLYGAEKGAARAVKEVMYAREALNYAKTEEKIDTLKKTIAREERLAGLENERIVFLHQSVREDKKKQEKAE
jgi:hypothetical protein